MASLDQDISKSIWYGKVPVQVQTEPSDPTECVYMEVARCSYLPMLTHALCAQVDRLEGVDPASVWYSFQGEPLKWHHPVGLLYDLLCSAAKRDGKELPLPWPLTMHTDAFPESALLRNPNMETTQDMFMAMIKEADFLRHGSTKKVMNLSKQDQTQLWQALTSERYDDYWQVNHSILDERPGTQGTSSPKTSTNNTSGPRHVPLRLYLPNQCPVIQDLVPFTSEQGDPVLLSDAMQQLLPKVPLDDMHIMIHGVTVPVDTPIRWAIDHLAYPDNFLHLVVF
ncbi:autophagy protein Apg5-domain-containing protein [Gongronella butleri]|nr:autophagy protein Apg5-domain-containing protein [Gongronella butleri]